MKSVILGSLFCVLAYNSLAQKKLIPQSFPDIIKENKQPPLSRQHIITFPKPIRITAPVIISKTDHMPCVTAGIEYAAKMPVLQMNLQGYTMPNALATQQ